MPTATQLAISQEQTKQINKPADYITDKDWAHYIAPLYHGDTVPEVDIINVTGTIAEDAETVNVTSTGDVNIWQGLPLKLGVGQYIIPSKDYTLLDGVATDIDIVANPFGSIDATLGINAQYYKVFPLLSIEEGGLPETSSNKASANNRFQGMQTAHEKVTVAQSVSMSGTLNLKDFSADVFYDLNFNNIRSIYVIARRVWFKDAIRNGSLNRAGEGAPSCEYQLVGDANIQVGAEGYSQLSISGDVNSYFEHYLLDPLT